MDATLGDGLASNTSISIQVIVTCGTPINKEKREKMSRKCNQTIFRIWIWFPRRMAATLVSNTTTRRPCLKIKSCFMSQELFDGQFGEELILASKIQIDLLKGF